jgi:type I restriction enzyme S subunit
MAGDWTETTLAEVSSDVAYGYTESASLERVGPRFLRITDIQNGVVDWGGVPFCPISPEDHRKYRLRAGDIVVARTGNSTGENYLFRGNEDAVFASYLIRFRINGSTADPAFVWYHLRSAAWRGFINGAKTGSAQAGANAKVLGKFPLTLPPLPEQKRIAHVLGTLDDKIDLNRRMNATLEGISRAIFKSWFVDFDPVRQKAAGKQPVGMDARTAALFPDSFEESELGEIPKGWRVAVLENVLEVIETGGRPKGGVSGYLSGVPSIGAESVVGLGVFDYAKTKFVPRDFYEKMTKGRIQSRDVLLYKDGGRPGQFEPHVALFGDGFPFAECAINEHVYRLRARADFGQSLLYFWLSSDVVMEEMRVKGTGVAIPGLNSTQAKSLTTVRPSPTVAMAFDHRVEPAVARILSACNESRTLAALRDTLLPKLLSGEIRVPEAEKAVEEAIG